MTTIFYFIFSFFFIFLPFAPSVLFWVPFCDIFLPFETVPTTRYEHFFWFLFHRFWLVSILESDRILWFIERAITEKKEVRKTRRRRRRRSERERKKSRQQFDASQWGSSSGAASKIYINKKEPASRSSATSHFLLSISFLFYFPFFS